MAKEKDLSSLSESELDALIEYGIQQQENVQRHGTEYQHWLNVTAKAKQAKSAAQGNKDSGADIKAIADNMQDDAVEESQLATASPDVLNLTPDPSKKDIKDAKEEKAPEPVVKDGTQPPAENVNKGMKGVVSDKAKETPENQQK